MDGNMLCPACIRRRNEARAIIAARSVKMSVAKIARLLGISDRRVHYRIADYRAGKWADVDLPAAREA